MKGFPAAKIVRSRTSGFLRFLVIIGAFYNELSRAGDSWMCFAREETFALIDAINEEASDSLIRLQEEFVELIGVCTSSVDPKAANSLKRQCGSVSDRII
jgi:hypothetical protein